MAGNAEGKAQRAFVVDEHTLFREGLGRLVGPEFRVCGEAASIREALELLPGKEPDVLITEISEQRKRSGVDILKELRGRYPELPILVVSACDERLFAERALHAGASGYIMKTATAGELSVALQRVAGGGVYVDELMASIILRRQTNAHPAAGHHDRSELEALSDREFDIFVMIGSGRSSRDIATDLGISIKTVESHRSHIAAKLPLETSDRLLSFASRWVGANISG